MTNYNPNEPLLNLSQQELAVIDAEVQAQIDALGPPPTLDTPEPPDTQLAALGPTPTLDSLYKQGYSENSTLLAVIDWITGAGRVFTLVIAELIQSLAALTIAITFALLEYWRVYHGASALGQQAEQAGLIAFAVVAANIIHPIYRLQQLRGQSQIMIKHSTLRGYLMALWQRLFGLPSETQADLYHNTTLHIAAAIITWSTVILAVYDILGPLLEQFFTNSLQRPLPISIMELMMGLGLSIAGVFFLQAASHEIGVRILTDNPVRLADILHEKLADHAAQESAIRLDFAQRLETAKAELRKGLAARAVLETDIRRSVRSRAIQQKYAALNARRQQQQPAPQPEGQPPSPAPLVTPLPVPIHRNGNGSSNGHHG